MDEGEEGDSSCFVYFYGRGIWNQMLIIVKHTQLVARYSGGKNLQTQDGNPDLENKILNCQGSWVMEESDIRG